ncbi:SMP-30/Gluconolaconase/LRE-like region [Colletotrichum fioriniae PJ7]|uniref:SMP-30/Gluconolaconase/LRE-like region n=1 Tax=Colletotrichum fioriniae PJ7 TaxID=1445577 RepID=A0A010QTA1_9PEZI|nr:SMP-30/Gluconolaconase/LRE-like region [Colletotrichum fioriniae PJ7]
MSLINVDLHALATGGAGYLASINAGAILPTPAISLLAYQPAFADVLGPNATARKIVEVDWQAFHEGGIYNKKDNSLYISSNYNPTDNINITVLNLNDFSIRSTQFDGLTEANGGSSYYPPGADQSATPPMQVWCDQGDLTRNSQLLAVDPNTNKSQPLIVGFNGRNFTSLNDVRQHPVTGDLWFTDPQYGFFQKFRPESVLPTHIYRFEPSTGTVQVVADGFQQPNGVEFSPDGKTLYVSDTGAITTAPNLSGPATIYAFDIVDNKKLANKRVFAYADNGFPDGVHADTDGNVWGGCGDGIHVWNPEGVLLGKIHLGETSNNFAFAPGKVFVFSNQRLWVVENLKALGREVCKDFGADSDPRCAK